ncbi:hypothetical protein QR680_013212 [Steinernema hermaphroditum]|uniref:39S ribosomal protein L35, mitochondrial n=1 Tax=Steinernema hermaphroditum TaxID=289476 RepID=A0AA39I6B0_9BILA|nr:hypothetical protein QR680_013212 [Steinernema hermaphroditum]
MNQIRWLVSGTGSGLLSTVASSSVNSARGIARIPHYERHIRFDINVGRKRPAQDVLDRFKRLNNGMWIRARPGRTKLRYIKDENYLKTSLFYETCTKEECQMLDKMMTPFWLRPRYYVDDPYGPYHVRYGIKSPRVDDRGRFVRERPKILIEDSVAEQHFDDR